MRALDAPRGVVARARARSIPPKPTEPRPTFHDFLRVRSFFAYLSYFIFFFLLPLPRSPFIALFLPDTEESCSMDESRARTALWGFATKADYVRGN